MIKMLCILKRNDLFAFAIYMLFSSFSDSTAQSHNSIRRVSTYRGDTLIITGILSGTGLEKTFPYSMYYWYSSFGIYCNQGGYTGNLLHGEYLEFDKNKKMITRGFFYYGLKGGTWYNWHSNGLILDFTNWKNGRKHGKYVKYLQDGSQEIIGNYKMNKFNGKILTSVKDTIFEITIRNDLEKKRKQIQNY
jgi:hypothetical protein